ncbi:MAG TPA: hypothetical protein VM580_27860 [Labilithrix sp.]|jgi:Ca2+/H+ antiporter|nr:hypothetical protein [Labilithrix sp.]
MYLLVRSSLLVLGVSLFAIGRRRHERAYSITGASLFLGTLAIIGS